MTWLAIALGAGLSVVMGAANVYLGLRVGLVVSASIPAAVVAMAILNGALRRNSILEANLVQTAASAGESLSAGIIFTMPALILTGIWTTFDYWTTTLVAWAGGLLGVLFMIPMRRVFVVDSRELLFPEGVACAEVLRAGELAAAGAAGGESDVSGRSRAAAGGALLIFAGLAGGAIFKLCESLLGLLKSTLEWAAARGERVFYLGCDVSPALVAVGMIVGLPISVQIFTGGAIAWLVAIPLFSPDVPNTAGMKPKDIADAVRMSHVIYIGVGAMVVGGIASIWKVRRGMAMAVVELTAKFRPQSTAAEVPREERDLDTRTILWIAAACVLVTAFVYYGLLKSAGLTLLTTGVMLVMAFFFTAVASYIVGLVGNSNSPVSGMTITAVLGAGALLHLFMQAGWLEVAATTAIAAALGIAGIVCCAACTSGDVCNDLKTGRLVGASPRSQQILQVIGVTVAAFVLSPTMTVLHEGSLKAGKGGIGGTELAAPQAKLFAELTKGMFLQGSGLPWPMLALGAGLGVAVLVADWLLGRWRSPVRLYVMPVAVGVYLPPKLSVPILFGGIAHYLLTRRSRRAQMDATGRGVLLASGVIAGESLLGVFVGLLAYLDYKSFESAKRLGLSEMGWTLATAAAFVGFIAWMGLLAARRQR
ncbi:MAG: oligopeptide transporter, OPT family [Planctomycetales bacterium]